MDKEEVKSYGKPIITNLYCETRLPNELQNLIAQYYSVDSWYSHYLKTGETISLDDDTFLEYFNNAIVDKKNEIMKYMQSLYFKKLNQKYLDVRMVTLGLLPLVKSIYGFLYDADPIRFSAIEEAIRIGRMDIAEYISEHTYVGDKKSLEIFTINFMELAGKRIVQNR